MAAASLAGKPSSRMRRSTSSWMRLFVLCPCRTMIKCRPSSLASELSRNARRAAGDASAAARPSRGRALEAARERGAMNILDRRFGAKVFLTYTP